MSSIGCARSPAAKPIRRCSRAPSGPDRAGKVLEIAEEGVRFRSYLDGSEKVLEGALIIVVVFGFLSVAPAVWSTNPSIVREYAIQVLLACLGLALCIAERNLVSRIVPPVEDEEPKAMTPGSQLHP